MLTVVERVLAAALGSQRWDGPCHRSSSPTRPPHSMSGAMRSRSSPAELDELRRRRPRRRLRPLDPRRRGAGVVADRSRNSGRTGDAFVADALACFEQGDAREQQSWLRAIALWPEARAFLPSAIEACRTNIIPVFEALACENPYPAAHFPDRNFNQMVLKAMFNAIELSRIFGLPSSAATRSCREWRATTPRNAPRPDAPCPRTSISRFRMRLKDQ